MWPTNSGKVQFFGPLLPYLKITTDFCGHVFVMAYSIPLFHVISLFLFFSYSCFTTFSFLFSNIISIIHVFMIRVCVHFIVFLSWCVRAWSGLIWDHHLGICFWSRFVPLLMSYRISLQICPSCLHFLASWSIGHKFLSLLDPTSILSMSLFVAVIRQVIMSFFSSSFIMYILNFFSLPFIIDENHC